MTPLQIVSIGCAIFVVAGLWLAIWAQLSAKRGYYELSGLGIVIFAIGFVGLVICLLIYGNKAFL